VNPKDIKCLLQWWGKHDIMFFIVGFFACEILGIIRLQIEIDFFSFNEYTYKPNDMSFTIRQLKFSYSYE